MNIEMKELNQEDIYRYSRHLLLPEVGVEGQKKLKGASVLVIGAGGLGAPVLIYLAAAGVGRIGVIDMDTIEISNLQRQIIHRDIDLGKSKAVSAKRAIHELNPTIEVEVIEDALTSENGLEIAKEYDIIIDGTDNFPTRYLVNDICVLLGKPLVYGSILRFEGQASVFWSKTGPCYRCLYPEPPPAGLVPNCAEGGVVGVLPGMIGTIQANEALKLILGVGESLSGRLLTLDALSMEFRSFELQKNPACPVCGDKPSITGLIDYEFFCGSDNPVPLKTKRISCQDLKTKLDVEDIQLLDIRSFEERKISSIEPSIHIPLQDLEQRMGELDKTDDVVVYCKYGPRGDKAVQMLNDAGFPNVHNLEGGILKWKAVIDDKIFAY